jgi:sugar phosphate permease
VMTAALYSTAAIMGMLPTAGGMGTTVLSMVLFVNGLAQGPTFPTNSVILGRWITPVDRSWANSVTEAGSPLGGLLAMGGTPIIASFVGWRRCCYVYSMADFCFAAVWQRYAASCPEECAYLTCSERDQLSAVGLYTAREDKEAKQRRSSTTCPWQVLLAPSALVVMLCHACFNFGRYFLYAWMPTFMHEHFSLLPEVGGIYLMPAEITNCLAMYAGGIFATYLLRGSGTLKDPTPTIGLWEIRRCFTCGGFVGAGLALVMIGHAQSPMMATVALCFEGFSNGMHSSGFKANYQDLSEQHRGVLAGVSNTVATIASTIEPVIVAEALREVVSWPTLFTAVGMLFASAGVIYTQFGGVRNLDTPQPPSVRMPVPV